MKAFGLFNKKSFGIDLGNNNTVVGDEYQILIDQPSYIGLDSSRKLVKAVGNEAYDMFEKTHQGMRIIKPLKGGVIADYDSATKMLRELMRKVYTGSFLKGYRTIIAGVPYNTTSVERRALRNALEMLNASQVYLVFEPIAAALGMGLDIREPNGKMVVDIGGGITEIAVISLSGIASFQSVKVAGDTMDEDIRDYFRRNYNMAIGIKTAEQVKIHVGAALRITGEAPPPFAVKGKDLVTGIPVVREVKHIEIADVLEKSITSVETAILQTLEKCPPELAADIYENGIHVTGGTALLRGLKERLEMKIRIPVIIDADPLLSVTKGVTSVLRHPQKYNAILLK